MEEHPSCHPSYLQERQILKPVKERESLSSGLLTELSAQAGARSSLNNMIQFED